MAAPAHSPRLRPFAAQVDTHRVEARLHPPGEQLAVPPHLRGGRNRLEHRGDLALCEGGIGNLLGRPISLAGPTARGTGGVHQPASGDAVVSCAVSPPPGATFS